MIFHCRKGRADRASAPDCANRLDPPGLQSTFHKFFTLQDPSHRLCRFALAKNLPTSLEITFATTLSQHSLILQRKNQTRPGAQLKTSKNFKIMTYVSNIFNSSLNSNRKLQFFSVEVITFDGESFIEEVEARSAEEAQEIAASGYENVDYTMVQGCFAGW